MKWCNSKYGRVRRFLPCLLENIEFSAAPSGEKTLAAIRYLATLRSTRRQHIDDAPMTIITDPWKRLCYGKDGHLSRQGYPLCVMNKLQDSLRRRDIYVARSERWGLSYGKCFSFLVLLALIAQTNEPVSGGLPPNS